MQSGLIRLIGVVFSNGTMLSVSDKSDSVNERTQEISELMKLHIQGVWQDAVNSFSTRLLSSCTDEYVHTYDISTYWVSSDRVS